MKSTATQNREDTKVGLGALLTPDNCVVILIDHQPFQFAGLRSHDTQSIINNVVGLAKSAKIFGVPTLLTTVLERQGGYLLKPLQDVFPEQKPYTKRSFHGFPVKEREDDHSGRLRQLGVFAK